MKTQKAKRIIGWVISGLVILFLLFDAYGKLAQLEQVVKFSGELGYPSNVIFEIGAILFISTLLYLVPRTSFIGAILLTGYLGGAVATHVQVEAELFTHTLFPVYFGILIWLGLYLRYPGISLLMPPMGKGKAMEEESSL